MHILLDIQKKNHHHSNNKKLPPLTRVQFGGVEGMKLPLLPLHMKVSPFGTANPNAQV